MKRINDIKNIKARFSHLFSILPAALTLLTLLTLLIMTIGGPLAEAQEKKPAGSGAGVKKGQEKPADDEPVAITEKTKKSSAIEVMVLTESQFGNFRYPQIDESGAISVLGLYNFAQAENRVGQRLFTRGADGKWRTSLDFVETIGDKKEKLITAGVPQINLKGETVFIGGPGDNRAEPAAVADPNDPAAQRTGIPRSGLFRKTASGIQPLMQLGGEVPNMPSVFTGISNISINGKGTVIFIGTYGDPDGRGLFYHHEGTLKLIARSGQRIGVGDTGTFSEHYYPSTVNDRDEVAFLGRVGDKSGIFLASTKGVELIAFTGRPSPVKGANFIGFGNRTPAINNKGEMAFVGFFDGPESGRGLFTRKDGVVSLLLRSGDTLPGTNYAFTDFSAPAINDRGDVAFIGNFAGRNRGLFIKTAKGVETIALMDQPIPGGTKEDIFNNFTQPAINARGEVVFYAQWKSARFGVDVGVFWRDQKGELKLLLRRGDEMPK